MWTIFQARIAKASEGGFTLLELMIAIAILAVISMIAAANFAGVFRSVSLTSLQKGIVTDTREAQAQAISGEYAMKWGVHFVNGATQYYEVFRTPTNYADVGTVVARTVNLTGGVTFTDPAPAGMKDILFDRTTGRTSADSVTITDNTSGATATVTVSAAGIIQ